MVLLDHPRHYQLLDLLDSLAELDQADGRDLLLQDLPPVLRDSIERSSAKRLDLDHIIDACDQWPSDNGTPPILTLLDNATALVEGSETATQLKALRDAWLAAPAADGAPLDAGGAG